MVVVSAHRHGDGVFLRAAVAAQRRADRPRILRAALLGQGRLVRARFRAIYLGLFFNCFIIASVNLAAVKIADVLFGWPRWETLLFCAIVPIIFAATAGLWGVMVTDTIQFCITMTAAFAAAYFAMHAPGVGGLARDGRALRSCASAPAFDSAELSAIGRPRLGSSSFRSPCSGGRCGIPAPSRAAAATSRSACSPRAPRTTRSLARSCFKRCTMRCGRGRGSSSRSPRRSSIRRSPTSTRAFPYVSPALLGNDIAYPAMLVFLPAGFAGFMVAGIFAAYRSTIETHLNWGTSYLVHDFYRRFIRRDADEQHYVFVGRVVTVLLMVVGVGVTFLLDNAKEAFNLLLSIGAGHRA